ncbi:hypothetical protein C4D60_Mb08t07040 [Musa balbisiana]|uniref:Inosine/uridine-preferring nucleoside hydrolase domain-containing protein n=1 Tax=Musa balbisiana TaxID=52838 RepID=A0A4S8K1Y0_MUSBA|nr:hypothetical protein C4D60_Mb08t07040 [Musa balbisiana]
MKVIIDTDPGIDDSMAILMAFQKPEIEVLGLTTIFGNVFTEDATSNALLLCEIAGHPEVPVAEGSHEPLKAIKRDSSFAKKVKKVVILGGSFFAAGNVSPAAEANICGDPEAADIVFTSGADIVVVGINITTQVKFTDADLCDLRNSQGRHSQILSDMCKFYRDWHVKWNTSNPWTGYSPVSVAWTVDVPGVLSFVKQLLAKP